MSKYPELTEPDKIIMEILWRDGECSTSVIQKEIESSLKWSRQTVRTYVVRLIEKGLVGAKVFSTRTYTYYPKVSKEEYASDRAKDMVNKYYGSVQHLVAGLLKKETLTEEEFDELEQLIHEARAQKKE